MAVAVGLLVTGLTLVYSAVKGLSMVEIFRGETGNPLNPKGGTIGDLPTRPVTSADSNIVDIAKGKSNLNIGSFKGPQAANLYALSRVAVNKYHLRITQICRPQNATYGAPNSLHKQCRAFDSTGSIADRVAFARYAKSLSWVQEVFCDQAGMMAPGYDHSDHVHVGS
jgi:hypothetical protein